MDTLSDKNLFQILLYETNQMIENFTYPYMPEEEKENLLDEAASKAKDVNVLTHKMNILNFFGIPSSFNLMN